jgi:hypothetical protein
MLAHNGCAARARHAPAGTATRRRVAVAARTDGAAAASAATRIRGAAVVRGAFGALTRPSCGRAPAAAGVHAQPPAHPVGSRVCALPLAAASDAGGGALPEAERCTFRLGDSEVTLETGRIGRQAGGAVMAREGDTALYTTICAADAPAADGSFLPLTVVYQERFSAAGRTASGFIKRDGKQRDNEVLTSRLVDRPLRPVFPDGYTCETQVLQLVLAWGGERTPDALAITAAGAALAVSGIPSSKPVAGVRVGWPRQSPAPVVNPTLTQARAQTACAVRLASGRGFELTHALSCARFLSGVADGGQPARLGHRRHGGCHSHD